MTSLEIKYGRTIEGNNLETLKDYLNRKVISRMVTRGDFKALNMTKGDETVFKTDVALADDHGMTKQALRYLADNGATINDKGHVLSGSRKSLSFVIKGYKPCE